MHYGIYHLLLSNIMTRELNCVSMNKENNPVVPVTILRLLDFTL